MGGGKAGQFQRFSVLNTYKNLTRWPGFLLESGGPVGACSGLKRDPDDAPDAGSLGPRAPDDAPDAGSSGPR